MTANCCSPDGGCHTGETAQTQPSAPAAQAEATATQAETAAAPSPSTSPSGSTVTYRVDGVGSAHCQAIVTKALGELDGVTGVEAGIGTGLVTVTTSGLPDDALIAAAVDEAGYGFAGRA